MKQVKYGGYLVWAINPAYFCRSKQIPTWMFEAFSIDLSPNMTKVALEKMYNRIKVEKELYSDD